MALPKLAEAYIDFVIRISFRPEAKDGLIIYNGPEQGGTDFIAFGLEVGMRPEEKNGERLFRQPSQKERCPVEYKGESVCVYLCFCPSVCLFPPSSYLIACKPMGSSASHSAALD